MISQTTVIVGVGSHHGDDQAGWRVANSLKQACIGSAVRVQHASSPIELLDWIDDADKLVVCDACRGLGPAGRLRRFDWPDQQLSAAQWSGTHDFSLVASLRLAEQLGRLPQQVVIWAIEASTDRVSEQLSDAVEAGVQQLAQRLAGEFAEATSSRAATCTNTH